jgi:hypothetical protein
MAKPPAVRDMSAGQLKLHYASLCQHHGCNGVSALATVHRITTEQLRAELIAYEVAARRKDWTTAEDALMRIAVPR